MLIHLMASYYNENTSIDKKFIIYFIIYVEIIIWVCYSLQLIKFDKQKRRSVFSCVFYEFINKFKKFY